MCVLCSDACDLTLDPNTANTHLVLSEENRKVTRVKEEQSYPDHPDRFEYYPQVLCSESLTGRCYWRLNGAEMFIYQCLIKKSRGKDGVTVCLDVMISPGIWSALIKDSESVTIINPLIYQLLVSPVREQQCFLDESSGSLSFYSVSDTHTLTHLHTFTHTFTQPLHAGFNLNHNSSVSLCHIKH